MIESLCAGPVHPCRYNILSHYADDWVSVRPSVSPIIPPQQQRVAGLLLSAMQAGGIDQQLPIYYCCLFIAIYFDVLCR